MFIVHLCVFVLFVILGVMFSLGKGASLIAGYNTMSDKEKESYDEKALCRFMSRYMFVSALCILVAAMSELFGEMALLWIGWGLFAVVIVAGVVYMNTGGRFRKG